MHRVNWPMLLTLSRFLMIPLFGWLFTVNIYYAILIAGLAGLTDMLDGYLARRLAMTSDWGKMLDPLADKLMLLTALFYLGTYDYIARSIFYLVLLKESAMVAERGSWCPGADSWERNGWGRLRPQLFLRLSS